MRETCTVFGTTILIVPVIFFAFCSLAAKGMAQCLLGSLCFSYEKKMGLGGGEVQSMHFKTKLTNSSIFFIPKTRRNRTAKFCPHK